jgi:hypothetical protein
VQLYQKRGYAVNSGSNSICHSHTEQNATSRLYTCTPSPSVTSVLSKAVSSGRILRPLQREVHSEPALAVGKEDILVLAEDWLTLRAAQEERDQAVAVGSRNLPVAVAVSKDLKGAVGAEVETRSDRRDFAVLGAALVKEQLAVEDILGAVVVESNHNLAALKDLLVVGLARRMNVDCPLESHSVQ